MSVTGVKGFEEATYDPMQMGEFILETFVGISRMNKMERKEKEAYKRETYPLVMSFFKMNNLQPTLSNLRFNKEVIRELIKKPILEDPILNMTGADKKQTLKIHPALIMAIPVLLIYLIIKL